MNYIIKNLKDLPLEGTHDLPDSRQTILTPDEIPTENFQAFTKGILQTGKVWDWHDHEGLYEFFIVLRGTGEINFDDGNTHTYKESDVIAIMPGIKHKITAQGENQSEFLFVRLK